MSFTSFCANHYDYSYARSPSWQSTCILQPLFANLPWDPYAIAIFAFQIIQILALTTILFWTFLPSTRNVAATTSSRFFIGALTLSILAFSYQAIDLALGESLSSVKLFYLLFSEILFDLQYLADALLLAAIFNYLDARTSSIKSFTTSKQGRPSRIWHWLLCSFLTVLWGIMTIVVITETVQRLEDSDYDFDIYDIRGDRHIIVFCFDALYLLAAMEILGRSIMATKGSRPRSLTTAGNSQVCLPETAFIDAYVYLVG
ncbi:MAG: hypothetical protein Q9169_007321 [Polycauliona sp. 2 TL-2023]